MEEQPRGAGRPPATSHAAIEAAAFRLFREHGFEDTTLDDIAEAVGVGRRTLFRYFRSKNDIPWGRFDEGLAGLRQHLETVPAETPVFEAISTAVLEFNTFPPDALAQHRERMRLILSTPALQAHSALRYRQWREVIAEFAATRYGLEPDDLLPLTIGHVSLALSMSAYEQWLEDDTTDLTELFAGMGELLRCYISAEPPEPGRRAPEVKRGRNAAKSRAARAPRRTPAP